MKSKLLIVGLVLMGILLGAAVGVQTSKNDTNKTTPVVPVGTYAVTGSNYKNVTVSDGWATFTTKKNGSEETYFLVEGYQGKTPFVVLQSKNGTALNMYAVTETNGVYNFNLVQKSKPSKEVTFSLSKNNN